MNDGGVCREAPGFARGANYMKIASLQPSLTVAKQKNILHNHD